MTDARKRAVEAIVALQLELAQTLPPQEYGRARWALLRITKWLIKG